MSTAHDLAPPPYPDLLGAAEQPQLALVPAAPAAGPLDLDAVLARAAVRLRRYALRRLGDPHEAEEIVQEALLRAYQHRQRLATEDDLMAWATVVTGRLIIDRARVRGRSVAMADVPEPHRAGRDTAEVVVARDEARAALDALESLPHRQAAVLWSREVEGLSYAEIADRYDLNDATVRSLLHRARKSLRREYAARGGSLPVAGVAVLSPWVAQLRGLGRLHAAARSAARSARTAAAPAGVGATAFAVAGAALVTLGLGLGGHQPAPRAAPAVSVQPARAGAGSTGMAPVRRGARPLAAAPIPGAAGWGSASGSASAPSTSLAAGTRSLISGTHACPKAPGSGPAGVNCSPARAPGLYLTPTLPDNPLGWQSVGAGATVLDCSAVPGNPLVACVPADDGGSTAAPSPVPSLPSLGAR